MTHTSSVPTVSTPIADGVRAGTADPIDFAIRGQEMQFVEIELDPGESTIAEAGGMMFKDAAVAMTTVFGDGSPATQGFMGKLKGFGRRMFTGESLFMTMFTHEGQGKAHIAFAAPYPGTIIPFKLSDMGGTMICQKEAFLCAAKGVSIGIHFRKKVMTGLFGGEGFIMQKLEGDGWAFIHVGGCVIERELGPGEELHVDTGCLAAMTPTVEFDIVRAGNIKSMIFGGEGLFLAHLKGPGKVWLQSLPFSRLVGRIGATGAKGSWTGSLFSGDSS